MLTGIEWPRVPPGLINWDGWYMPSRYFWRGDALYIFQHQKLVKVLDYPIALTHHGKDGNGTLYVRLQWFLHEQWHSVSFPLASLSKHAPSVLSTQGAPLTSPGLVRRFLSEWYTVNVDRLLPLDVVTQSGWINDQQFVWGGTLIEAGGISPHAVDMQLSPFSRWMTYQSVNPGGESTAFPWWTTTVLPKAPHLVLGLALIGSALLLRPLERPGFVMHIVDKTSTGKTTSAMLLASILGNPHHAEGLIQPWRIREHHFAQWLYWMRDSVWFIDDASASSSVFGKRVYLSADGNTPGYLEGTRGVTFSSSERYPVQKGGVAARMVLWPQSLLPFGVPVEAWTRYVLHHPEEWGWGWTYLLQRFWSHPVEDWKQMWQDHRVDRPNGIAQRWQNHWNTLWCGIRLWFPPDSVWIRYFLALEADWWQMNLAHEKTLKGIYSPITRGDAS